MSNELILEDFLISGTDLKNQKTTIYKTCLSMDIALNGGIPAGTNVLISGKAKSGKTTFVLNTIGRAMKEDPEIKAFYFDVEGRLQTSLLNCIEGLDLSRFSIVRSSQKKILTAEDYMNLILSTLKDNPGCICVLDSVAALCTNAEMSTEIGGSVKLAGTPTIMYKMFRQTSQILPLTKSTYIALTHMIANPSPMSKSTMTVGGNALLYGASVWLEIPWDEKKKDKNDKIIGQTAKFHVYASALGGPGSNVDVPITYGKGIDKNKDLCNVAIEYGLINKSASWLSFDLDGNTIKLQGEEKMTEYLANNPSVAESLEKQIRNMAITS